MPAGKQHSYIVTIQSYNSPKTRAIARRGERITGEGRLRVEVVYSGVSWHEARHALGLAVVRANRLKLAYGVLVLRDYQIYIAVKVEH